MIIPRPIQRPALSTSTNRPNIQRRTAVPPPTYAFGSAAHALAIRGFNSSQVDAGTKALQVQRQARNQARQRTIQSNQAQAQTALRRGVGFFPALRRAGARSTHSSAAHGTTASSGGKSR